MLCSVPLLGVVTKPPSTIAPGGPKSDTALFKEVIVEVGVSITVVALLGDASFSKSWLGVAAGFFLDFTLCGSMLSGQSAEYGIGS